MKQIALFLPVFILIITGCKKTETAAGNVNYLNNPQHVSVLTQHNDNTRAGLNAQETLLTTSNVNSHQFGKLFSLTVDDQVIAQPLVVGGLSIGSGSHNVVFIATVSNSVYAYDGDNGTLYWTKNYTASAMRTPKAADMQSSWCAPQRARSSFRRCAARGRERSSLLLGVQATIAARARRAARA